MVDLVGKLRCTAGIAPTGETTRLRPQAREVLNAAADALDAIPDQIDIYRAIKRSGARKHGDIAKVVADLLKPIREQSS